MASSFIVWNLKKRKKKRKVYPSASWSILTREIYTKQGEKEEWERDWQRKSGHSSSRRSESCRWAIEALVKVKSLPPTRLNNGTPWRILSITDHRYARYTSNISIDEFYSLNLIRIFETRLCYGHAWRFQINYAKTIITVYFKWRNIKTISEYLVLQFVSACLYTVI